MIKDRFRSAGVVVASTLGLLLVAGGTAFATDPTTPSDVIAPAADALKTNLLQVAAVVAIAAVVILGVRKGWKLLRSMF